MFPNPEGILSYAHQRALVTQFIKKIKSEKGYEKIGAVG